MIVLLSCRWSRAAVRSAGSPQHLHPARRCVRPGAGTH